MYRLLIPIALLLLIDFYFFQSIRTIGQDLTTNWRIALYILYWTTSLLSFLVLFVAGSQEPLSKPIRYYLFSSVLVLLIPKLVGILVLLGEDAFRVGSGFWGIATDSNEPFLQ